MPGQKSQLKKLGKNTPNIKKPDFSSNNFSRIFSVAIFSWTKFLLAFEF
jgi:hypothetical protein